MAHFKDLTDVWKNIREFDLRPLREAALGPLKIALIGDAGSGRHTLLDQMRRDASGGAARGNATLTPAVIATPETAASAEMLQRIMGSDLIVFVLKASPIEEETGRRIFRSCIDSGKSVLVFINGPDDAGLACEPAGAGPTPAVSCSALDSIALQERFVPVVLALLPDRHLALGRQFPLFRRTIARHLIDDTCRANAAYALGTGIAEAVPLLDLPFNIADMVVLTKAQAFLAYKLGLALGFSTNWHDYITEFGSVIGGGFLWRQIARQLVGLIPVWGIIPKVAVAYAGTFVVGNTVLQWYLTGRRISKTQIREWYLEAFRRGRQLAEGLAKNPPRLLRKRDSGTSPAVSVASRAKSGKPKSRAKGPKALPPLHKHCSSCGKDSAADALFCQYCGQAFGPDETAP